MSNLLKETLELLESNNKKETDVKWVGTSTHKTTWEDFKKNADVDMTVDMVHLKLHKIY